MKQIGTAPQSPQHRLLGGWRDVLDDVRALNRVLLDLPSACTCGDGASHLGGTCRCCGRTATRRVPACNDCDRLLARLRPAIDAMSVDTFRFFPFVGEFLSRHDAVAAARMRSVRERIAALRRSFGDLVAAEGVFRQDCRTSHLATVKTAAGVLLHEAEALDRALA